MTTRVNPYSRYDDEYNHVDDFPLTIIATIEDQNASYSFDMIVVWQDKTNGKLYYGHDSGCSCPEPFDRDYFIDDSDTSLTELNKSDLPAFERYVKDWGAYESGYTGDENPTNANPDTVSRFLRTVEDFLVGVPVGY